ncbi:hypothetical protein ACP275_07G059200 [Erythranthe tilingii]
MALLFQFHLSTLFFLLIIATNFPSQFSAQTDVVPYKIQIISETNTPITIHCFSADKDYGTSTNPWSFVYQFTYDVVIRFGLENIATCDITDNNTRKGRFNVFEYLRDTVRCKEGLTCVWHVRPDGIYEAYNNQLYLTYKW